MYVDSRGTLARSRAYNLRRREPRYVSSVPVALQRFLRFGPFLTRGVSLDVSVRGMSALVCGAPRVGETVVISLPLLHTPVEMLATVRHSTDAKSGFEFYPLSPIAQQGIQAWIQELEKHEESLFPYPNVAAAKAGRG
jgi:PilZ domain